MSRFGSERPTPNAERPMLNSELSDWALSVERVGVFRNEFIHALYLRTSKWESFAALLEESGFEFAPKEWTIFFAQKNKLSVAVYEKGPKVLVQGRGVEEFVQFELEPKVLGEAKLGYEEVHSPEMFEPHFGVDESGKGDFFGPLVISGVYVDRGIARKLLDARRGGQQADQLRCADSRAGGHDSENFTRSGGNGSDRPGQVQRAIREVWQFEPASRMGARTGDREFAGAKAGLPAVFIGPVRRRARNQGVLDEAWA